MVCRFVPSVCRLHGLSVVCSLWLFGVVCCVFHFVPLPSGSVWQAMDVLALRKLGLSCATDEATVVFARRCLASTGLPQPAGMNKTRKIASVAVVGAGLACAVAMPASTVAFAAVRPQASGSYSISDHAKVLPAGTALPRAAEGGFTCLR